MPLMMRCTFLGLDAYAQLYQKKKRSSNSMLYQVPECVLCLDVHV